MNKIVLDDLVDQIKEENYELKKEKNQLIMRVFHDMECELERKRLECAIAIYAIERGAKSVQD